MDFSPESVTLGSVETSVFFYNEARARNNAGNVTQPRNLGESVFVTNVLIFESLFPEKAKF